MKNGLLIVVIILVLIGGVIFFRNFASNSAIPKPTPVTKQKEEIKLFLIALDDNGKAGVKVGCNDSLVPITREVTQADANVTTALNALLTLDQGNQGGFYNALGQSSLTIQKVTEKSVYLEGALSMGGVCDAPRIEEQLKATVEQFPQMQGASIFINNIFLHDAVSER